MVKRRSHSGHIVEIDGRRHWVDVVKKDHFGKITFTAITAFGRIYPVEFSHWDRSNGNFKIWKVIDGATVKP